MPKKKEVKKVVKKKVIKIPKGFYDPIYKGDKIPATGNVPVNGSPNGNQGGVPVNGSPND